MLGKKPEGMPQIPIEPWEKGRWVFRTAKGAWMRRDSWHSNRATVHHLTEAAEDAKLYDSEADDEADRLEVL